MFENSFAEVGEEVVRVIDKDYEREAVCIRSLIELAKQGETVRLLGKGISMRPLLRDGKDYIDLVAVTEDVPLRRGDVVLYLSDGVYVLHRIHRIRKDMYAMLGDGNLHIEPYLPRDQIFLKAVGYVRRGRSISAEDWRLRLYGWVWMRLRIVRPIIWKILYHWNKWRERGH